MKKKIFLTFVFTLIAVASTLAGPGPNPCDDPDAVCDTPLDTWVMILAAVALIFTTVQLLRKQKAAINAA